MFVKQWDRDICINCMTCVKVCPNDNLVEFNHKPTRAKINTCTGCNHCTTMCPTGAIYHIVVSDEGEYGGWNPAVIQRIASMSKNGKHVVEAKGSKRNFINLNDLIFLPAQIQKSPRLEDEPVHTEVTIGPRSKRPLHLNTPIMIGAMSFGALSREAKIALAQASARVGSAANSGEGGMLPEERAAASQYILQYSTGRFGINDEVLQQADAIEIKLGQGAKPGMGGHLLGPKVTVEIAEVRGIMPGTNAISPSRHLDIDTPQELGERIEQLREKTGGVPIGIKITGGHIERDLQYLIDGTIRPDFLVIDGGEGGTGAAPVVAKDNVALPLLYSLSKVVDILTQSGLKESISIVAAGGMKNSEDFAKAIALGADAVYTAGSLKIAMGCIYCRACHTGKCPTGICTQNKRLRKLHFDIERATDGVSNFITAATGEIADLTRIVGKRDIAELNRDDLFSLTETASQITGIRHI
ncbi:MAG: 4Fe-4S binding protein [Gammaproteobacteria bacterium]|jgi:methylamine---glutamate N-methyltransferase subunit C|nr:4Fe-4S binding protein [Gammaproteobacteria bacterium]